MKNLPLHRRARFALNGLREAWRDESSFRLQSAAGLGVIALAALLNAPPVWWAIFFLIISAILALELLNTALERLADRLHPELHAAIRTAKDCAAGGVLLLSIASVGIFIAFLVEEFGKRLG
ncbi:MAG: diacylglycerol kinase [Oligoflexia bacterium]|nr:diacylglycerol kinase [Oligoflexia bacterium]